MSSFIESFIVVAILLVLVQTFLEDFGVIADWTWSARRILVITGFAFDLFFTVEFLSRLYSSVYAGKGSQYFVRNRGWIDLMASVPLLLLSSGPAFIALVTGGSAAFALGSMLNMLKVVKAIRIARILRLLRVLKIFKQIKYTDSVMAQRHVAKITSMTITLLVVLIFGISLLTGFVGMPEIDGIYSERNMRAGYEMAIELDARTKSLTEIVGMQKSGEDILLIKHSGTTLYSRYDNTYYRHNYGTSDYQYVSVNDYDFFFDIKVILKMQAKDNIIYFSIVIVFVLFLLIYYSPHFALTVTDPIHVMRKGLDDDTYNLEVRIPERYKDDDVYQLADAYNRIYLPMKDRQKGQEEGTSSLLKLDDVKDLLGGV